MGTKRGSYLTRCRLTLVDCIVGGRDLFQLIQVNVIFQQGRTKKKTIERTTNSQSGRGFFGRGARDTAISQNVSPNLSRMTV